MTRSYSPDQPAPAARLTPQQQTPKLPLFEVVKITPVEQGTLLGFADIQFGRGPNAFTICKFRLIHQEGQPPWLSAPQETWVTENGERRYTNLFVYPKEWKTALTNMVIDAWKAHQVSQEANQ